ncbi:MAG: VacB/RNase II family 3'-5' exoribonuclease [Acidobacteria bacterium]|nr:VacB/RNase II family 3'-5' exoribonuclease [Acidobacteriota bacterium]
MKRFKIRKRKRDAGNAYHEAGRPQRRRRRFEEGREVEGPRAARAAVWPGEVAVPWPKLLVFLADNREKDLSVPRLVDMLKVPVEAMELLREQIALLEREKFVIHHRRGRISWRSRDRIAVGRLSIPASSRTAAGPGVRGGFGFVAAPGADGDLFIPGRDLSGAGHGDLVVARGTTSGREEKARGAVVAILERAPTVYSGVVESRDGRLVVRPRDDRRAVEMPAEEDAGPEAVKFEAGDLVLAEAVGGARPRARVVSSFGDAMDSRAVEEMVIRDLGLPGEFPEEVEREAEAAARKAGDEEIAGREDFRALTTITIDPEDARDFDDAFSIETLAGGVLRLWVHIADVSHYVRPGSALDAEAVGRGTSVYLPGRVIPMLPHSLSSGICSLVEGEDRLVQSVAIDYTADAEARRVRFASGVIRSAARLTYAEAASQMEDPSKLSLKGEAGRSIAALFTQAAPLARRLTRNRVARGAIDLDLPEVEFRKGIGGGPGTIALRERTAANRLIEEFMLAANEAVAKGLSDKGVPSLYRVHEAPDVADIEEVEETIAALGAGKRGGRSLAARLQALLSRFRDRPEEGIIARHVLRAMKLARYSEIRAEHFGLALKHYAHFTSPIRRYPDLIVHAILRASGIAGARPLYGLARLSEIAAESSRLERRAEEAERAVNDLIMARVMRERVGEIFEGRISGSVKTGVFVQLSGKDLPPGAAEGFVPVAQTQKWKLAEVVRVKLEEADLLRGRLRLSLVSAAPAGSERKRR